MTSYQKSVSYFEVRNNFKMQPNKYKTIIHQKLQFYPSPFANTLRLQNAMVGISYRLYDLKGRLICKGITTSNELVLQTGDWNEGTYLAELILPDGSRQVRKIVK